MKISFSNFPQTLSESEIEKLFSGYGEVKSLILKKDKLTKKSLGYGTVEMEDAAGDKAIAGLNNTTKEEKVLAVGNLEELQSKVSSKKGSLPSNNLGGGKFHGRNQASGGAGPSVLRRGGNRGT